MGGMGSAGRSREAGYSLVEVIVSLGILTGVIVAIASMFVLAQSNVKSGRLMTEATSIAQDIMEDINKLSYNGIQQTFGSGTSLTTLNSFTTCTDVVSTIPACDTTGEVVGKYANTQYQNIIKSHLWKGYASIKLQPIGGVPKPATFASGEALRVTVEVHWTELRRSRSVTVEGVRF